MVSWEQQPGNSIILCIICKSGIFYNVAMTETGTLLGHTVAFSVMPNKDFGSANGRVSLSIFGLLGYLR